MKKILKSLTIAAIVAASVTGCTSIANRIADAIAPRLEPRLEQIIDKKIEHEEKLQGIWGTTNSYFYSERTITESELRAQADELIEAYREELMERINKIIEEKFGK